MTTIHHTSLLMSETEIKDMIKQTNMKTAEFIQAVIEDAELTRATSCKSPKKLVELWTKRELSPGSLRLHVKRVFANAEKKPAKAPKAAKAKATKSATANGAKRGRPRKTAAPILLLADQCDQLSWRM